MSQRELPNHWRFAFGQAVQGLNRLAHDFDFTVEAGKFAYAGVPTPEELIALIDGFLAEQELLPGGEITRLQQLREDIHQRLVPAYQAGEQATRDRWRVASAQEYPQLAGFSNEQIMAEAWRLAPALPSEANWFVEGFCRRWRLVEEMNCYREQYDPGLTEEMGTL